MDVEAIALGLDDFEREFLTGWQGPGGACFNMVATGLVKKGLLKSLLDWTPNELGKAVAHHLTSATPAED